MGQEIHSTRGPGSASEIEQRYGLRTLFRKADQTLLGIERECFSRDRNSNMGLRVAAVRLEIQRLSRGLPIRGDSILRAVGSLRTVIPIRRPAA